MIINLEKFVHYGLIRNSLGLLRVVWIGILIFLMNINIKSIVFKNLEHGFL
jgi:hypothetical protein